MKGVAYTPCSGLLVHCHAHNQDYIMVFARVFVRIELIAIILDMSTRMELM